MYYSTHTRNHVSIFEFFFCNEEPAVKGVCHLPVKVGCQSTLTLLLRRVSPHVYIYIEYTLFNSRIIMIILLQIIKFFNYSPWVMQYNTR